MYSLPAHKEFRFLLPALLLLMPYCGTALHDLHQRWGTPSATADPLLHQVYRQDDHVVMAHSLLSKTTADRCLSMTQFIVQQMHVNIQTIIVPKTEWYMQAHTLSVHATLLTFLLLLLHLLTSPVHMLVIRHSW